MKLDFVNPDLVFLIIGIILALIGLSTLYYGIFAWVKRGSKIQQRLDTFVATDGARKRKMILQRIVPREVNGSLINRTIIRWLKSIVTLLGRLTPESQVSSINHKLCIAGNPMNLRAGEFFAIQLFFGLIGIFLAFLINHDLKNMQLTTFLLSILVFLFFLLMPKIWLNGLVRSRQDEIRRGLPDALDMLSVCASAGLGFDQSLQKISSYWKTDLGNEFKRVIHEMEMGVPRSNALKSMSERLDVEDLSRFISIIIQAESLGMSYADVLHSQAVQMRILRQYRVREIANKLPAKMIIPLALLIFPALIAVILGPVIPILFNLF